MICPSSENVYRLILFNIMSGVKYTYAVGSGQALQRMAIAAESGFFGGLAMPGRALLGLEDELLPICWTEKRKWEGKSSF